MAAVSSMMVTTIKVNSTIYSFPQLHLDTTPEAAYANSEPLASTRCTTEPNMPNLNISNKE